MTAKTVQVLILILSLLPMSSVAEKTTLMNCTVKKLKYDNFFEEGLSVDE